MGWARGLLKRLQCNWQGWPSVQSDPDDLPHPPASEPDPHFMSHKRQ